MCNSHRYIDNLKYNVKQLQISNLSLIASIHPMDFGKTLRDHTGLVKSEMATEKPEISISGNRVVIVKRSRAQPCSSYAVKIKQR